MFHNKPRHVATPRTLRLLACYVGAIVTITEAFSPVSGSFCHHPRVWSSCPRQQSNHFVLSALDDSADTEQIRQQDRMLSLLGFIQNRDEGRLPCGLDATEKEQELVASVVAEVELDDSNNLLTIQNGKIEAQDLFGDWKLLYTSSRTMIINKSLSGLGRSSSDSAQFASLVQKLGGSKYLGTVEFVEQFGQGDDGLKVFVTGEWFTRPERNTFTGSPTTAIEVKPEKVVYGPSKNDAEMWSSLGPIRRTDITYKSDDIMISRVNVNPDYLFIWQRIL